MCKDGKICIFGKHPNHKHFERGWEMGKLTEFDIASKTGIRHDVILDHMANLSRGQAIVKLDAKSSTGYLEYAIDMLQEKIQAVAIFEANQPSNIKSLVLLMKEMRSTLADLREADKEFGKGAKVQVNVLIVGLNKMMNFIITYAPPEFQEKFLDFMETELRDAAEIAQTSTDTPDKEYVDVEVIDEKANST